MSLLMDALKKAEEAKEQATTQSSNEERVALSENGKEEIAKSEQMLDDLSLLQESAENLLDKPIENSEPVESELSLEPKESVKSESNATTNEVAAPDSTKSGSSSSIELSSATQSESAKLVQEIKSEKHSRVLTDNTLATPNVSAMHQSTLSKQDKSQRIYKVSSKRNSRKPILYIGFGLGLFSIVGGVAYYYYSGLTSDIQQVSVPVSTQTVEAATKLVIDEIPAETESVTNNYEETSEIIVANEGKVELVADAGSEPVEKIVVQAKKDNKVKPVVTVFEAPEVKPVIAKPKKITKPKISVKPVTAPKPSANIKQAIKTPVKKQSDEKFNIVRQEKDDPILSKLENAYKFYQVGNFENAKQVYQSVLSKESSNRDARLGLAAIALQSGDLAQAHRHYKYLLKINSKDSVALSGVMSAITGANALKSESQIKLLLDQEPQAAHLHFTLGNLMAAQSRWSDAQQSYFQAYSFDPDNADYAYNLAISLDYLGQKNTAITYYKKSLVLSKNRNVSFSAAAVVKRMNSLIGKGTTK